MKLLKFGIIGAAVYVIFALVSSGSVSSLAADKACHDIETIFARGSGQSVGEENAEAFRFFEQLNKRIPGDKISHVTYELGTEPYGSHKYEAVNVSDKTNWNALGAKFSSGYANDYGKSVDSGVGELYNYLTQRYDKCKNTGTKFVLGGYSQGAQVIGQTLPKFSAELRSKVVFAALFGDPKLHLPEGEGYNPPACQGKGFSEWRRVIGNCDTDNGSLGARKPYLPDDMKNKTGLWCYSEDFVCGTTKNPFITAGHDRYRLESHAIDEAVVETVGRLAKELPQEKASYLVQTKSTGAGTTGLDVVFVLDTTGSMIGQIEQTKDFIRSSAARIKDLRGRVALTVYRDAGDIYTAKILSDLQDTPDDLLAKLETVTADDGGDWQEAGLHALMTSFNGLNWKNGATKAAILLTDAPNHEPDLVDGSTVESVAARSLEIDPVNVYPVVSSDVAPYHTRLAELTSGQVISDTGDTVVALETALTKIEQRPTALLKNTEYSAEPGQEIRFDASDSYVIDAEITEYAWDFDGDGSFDLTTVAPVATHVYSQPFNGTMQVRLKASNGTISNASAVVKVATIQPPALPAAPRNLKHEVISTAGNLSTIRLSWAPADSLAASWLVSVNGIPLGRSEAAHTSVEITEVLRDSDQVFSVTGLTADGETGEPAEITLAKITAPAPQPSPSKPSILQLVFGIIRQVLTGIRSLLW